MGLYLLYPGMQKAGAYVCPWLLKCGGLAKEEGMWVTDNTGDSETVIAHGQSKHNTLGPKSAVSKAQECFFVVSYIKPLH